MSHKHSESERECKRDNYSELNGIPTVLRRLSPIFKIPPIVIRIVSGSKCFRFPDLDQVKNVLFLGGDGGYRLISTLYIFYQSDYKRS